MNKDLLIVTVSDPDPKILRKKTSLVHITEENRVQLKDLIKNMRVMMRDAEGVGLSANQIGLDMRLFVAEVPPPNGKGKPKFYAVVNPEIIKQGKETDLLEEGCLSVPDIYGPVARSTRIVISGLDPNGKPLKIKAWGFLARVFQHEVDHLNGFLILDRAKKFYEIAKSDRLATREKRKSEDADRTKK
ncbi:MAG: peptide deformylase [Patescibacteria group bacterium]